MNIAMFTNTYLPGVGGIENSIETFAQAMRKKGHSVLIVAPEYEGATQSTEFCLRVPAITRIGGSPYSIKISVPGIVSSRLRDFKPDVIHSHQPFLLGDTALRMARMLDVPIIYTNHTFMERYLHWFPVDWKILKDIAERLPVAYGNLVDYVVTPTPSVAEILVNRGVKKPIMSIPTGIDASFFAGGDGRSFREQFGLEESHEVLGHLGRLNTEKNLNYLAEVAVRFVQSHENRRFLLVGEGDSVDSIHATFAAQKLQSRLVYAGLQQGQQCADAYAAMDAFIFTSLSDTQGLVLSEAMAAGNPVFALNAPGAKDIVHHGKNGWLFEVDTSAEVFAQGVIQAFSDIETFKQWQTAARQDAYAVNIENCTDKMLALYSSVQRTLVENEDSKGVWDNLVKRWSVESELLQEKLQVLLEKTDPKMEA